MTKANTTATKEVRIFQSTAKGAANKKSRVLGAVRTGKMSVAEAEANARYDVELSKILTVDEIAAAARGEGRKRGAVGGGSATVASALSKGSRVRSQFREGKLNADQVKAIWEADELLRTKFTLESLMAPARFTTVSIDIPVTADEDVSGDDDDDDDDFEDEDDSDDE